MKVGIDSYCFHRHFGEIYPHQNKKADILNMDWFLEFSKSLNTDGVSLESCFFETFETEYLRCLKQKLDHDNFDRVYAWGHPDGLEGGSSVREFHQMMKHIEFAERIGAKVMRVVGSSFSFRNEAHELQLRQLAIWFKEAQKKADDYGIKLAVENHIDFDSDEICQLLDAVDNPNFGVNFDSGNFVRVDDDPVKAAEKLAPRIWATHIKDLQPVVGVSKDEWYHYSCVPTGEGLVNNQKIAQILSDVGYQGFLAVETDTLHPKYSYREREVVTKSIHELKRISQSLEEVLA